MVTTLAPKVNPELIYLSQQHLKQWDECPLKFYYNFFDQVRLPLPPQQKDKLTLGSQFHLLLQQHELGLDISPLAASNPHLALWYEQFQKSPPEIISGSRSCETRRTFAVEVNQQRHYFTLVYDLLILGTDEAQIIDWKTHEKLIHKTELKASWQTRLYLYGLAITSNYPPETISMTYWFANQGKSTILNYSQAQHEKTHRDLQQRLSKMQQTDFTAKPKNSQTCQSCEFYYRCDAPQKHDLQHDSQRHSQMANITKPQYSYSEFDPESMDFDAYPEVVI